jgi:CarboxypepD_reg-like domain
MNRLIRPLASFARVAVLTMCALVFASCLKPNGIHLQQSGTVRGVVVDAITRRPLPSASVNVGSKVFGPTGTDGRFALLLPTGDQTLTINVIGYKSTSLTVSVEANQKMPFDIPQPIALTPQQ